MYNNQYLSVCYAVLKPATHYQTVAQTRHWTELGGRWGREFQRVDILHQILAKSRHQTKQGEGRRYVDVDENQSDKVW